MSAPPSEPAPRALTAPRVELICPGCRRVHEHLADDRGGETTCPECDHRFHAPETVPIIYVPWEDRGRMGWWQALYETVSTSLLAPKAFFHRMPISGGWLSPVSYVAIVGGVALAVGNLTSAALLGTGRMANLEPEVLSAVRRMHFTTAALAPVAAALTVLALAALVHLSVLLLKGAQPRLQTTARVCCYAASAQLLMVLPLIGLPLAALWTVVLVVIGLREAQELSTGKAVLATLSPLILALMLTVGPCRPPAQV